MEKENNSKVVKAGIAYTIGNYFVKGLSFLTIPIFVRLLNNYDYGMYNTYLAFEAIVYIFVGLALHTSFNKAKYKFKCDFEHYVSACLVLSILSFVVILFFAVLTYPFLQKMWGFEKNVVIILVVHSFGTALIQFYNSYISLFFEYKKFLKLSIFNALLSIILSIFLIMLYSDGQKYYGRVLGTVIPIIIIIIYIMLFFFKKAKPNIVSRYWLYAVKYSVPIIPHGLSQIVLAQFDRIMINNMVGAAEAGIYSFAYSIYTVIQVTSYSLSKVWEPWFFEKIEKGNLEAIRSKSQIFAVGMLGFSAVVVLISPELVSVLGTIQYSDAVYCIPPIVIGGYFSFLYILPCEVEYYYEKTANIGAATCVAAGVNYVLNYICIDKFGYVAAAYTTLITYFLYFLFHYLMARKIQGLFLYSNRMIFIITLLAFGVCFVGVYLIPYTLVRIIIAFVLTLGIYVYIDKEINVCLFIKTKYGRRA